eukprot:5415617-Pleurochrysis_carterae.AAC.1
MSIRRGEEQKRVATATEATIKRPITDDQRILQNVSNSSTAADLESMYCELSKTKHFFLR